MLQGNARRAHLSESTWLVPPVALAIVFNILDRPTFEINDTDTLCISTKSIIEVALSIIITQKPNKNCAVSEVGH